MELAKRVDLGHGIIGGTGGGGATAAQIEEGKDASSSGLAGLDTSSTITMIVPDGVATVHAALPSWQGQRLQPEDLTRVRHHDHAGQQPRRPHTPAPSNPLEKGTVIWRAAEGRVIKTIDGLGS